MCAPPSPSIETHSPVEPSFRFGTPLYRLALELSEGAACAAALSLRLRRLCWGFGADGGVLPRRGGCLAARGQPNQARE